MRTWRDAHKRSSSAWPLGRFDQAGERERGGGSEREIVPGAVPTGGAAVRGPLGPVGPGAVVCGHRRAGPQRAAHHAAPP